MIILMIIDEEREYACLVHEVFICSLVTCFYLILKIREILLLAFGVKCTLVQGDKSPSLLCRDRQIM